MKTLFLHGLDSSSQGTKGIFFRDNFPDVIAPDFEGTLENRLEQLEKKCRLWNDLTFIGSSFGGLMAVCYAIKAAPRIGKLILLAPALNFPEYSLPKSRIDVPTLLVIGKHDTVTPPDIVIPQAEKTFSALSIQEVDDDHLLHNTFHALNWQDLLTIDSKTLP